MQPLAFYLIKVIACSGILLLYYRLALRNKRFHYYNRFYLLATIAASILLPLLQINWFTISSNDKAIALLNVMYVQSDGVTSHQAAKGFSINWQQASLIAYSLVSLLFIAALFWRIHKIYSFKKKYSATNMGEFDFINTDLTQAPFSFLQNLFWRSDIDLEEATGHQILQHELTHIRQKHTVDKICMQVVLGVFWINPFYWFIQRELFMLHEFIADGKAIENNDGAAFAAMLLTSQYGKSIFSPGQSFAYSPIKRRLFMLTNLTKPRYSYLRRLMVLPLLACVLMLFAFRLQKTNTTVANNAAPNTEALPVMTPDTATALADTVLYTKPEKDTVIKSTESKQPIMLQIMPDTSSSGIRFTAQSVTFDYNKSDTTGRSKIRALIMVDGRELPSDQLNTLDPNSIESIRVLKGDGAIEKYGAKGAEGVIEIETKPYSLSSVTITEGTMSESKPKYNVGRVFITGYPDTAHKKDLNEVVVTGYPAKATRHYPDTAIWVQGYKMEQAQFPGGSDAWKKYLQENLQADIVTKKGGPPGRYTVVVSFIVDEDGNISEVKADNDPGFGTAAEAIRFIQHSPNWLPAKQNGKAVKYRQRQGITFVAD